MFGTQVFTQVKRLVVISAQATLCEEHERKYFVLRWVRTDLLQCMLRRCGCRKKYMKHTRPKTENELCKGRICSTVNVRSASVRSASCVLVERTSLVCTERSYTYVVAKKASSHCRECASHLEPIKSNDGMMHKTIAYLAFGYCLIVNWPFAI